MARVVIHPQGVTLSRVVPYVGAPEIKARRLVLAVRYHSDIGNPGLVVLGPLQCTLTGADQLRGCLIRVGHDDTDGGLTRICGCPRSRWAKCGTAEALTSVVEGQALSVRLAHHPLASVSPVTPRAAARADLCRDSGRFSPRQQSRFCCLGQSDGHCQVKRHRAERPPRSRVGGRTRAHHLGGGQPSFR